MLLKNRRKLQKVSRSPMSTHPRKSSQSPPSNTGRPSRSVMSISPSHQRLPIESLADILAISSSSKLKELCTPTPQSKTRGVHGTDDSTGEKSVDAFWNQRAVQHVWTGVMRDLHAGLLSPAPSSLEKRSGFVNGAEDWQTFRFNDLVVLGVERHETDVLLAGDCRP